MKNETKNIDTLLKETFENFEAKVDPSVWNNIQHAIAPSAGVSLAAKPSSLLKKAVLLKLTAGVLAVSTIAIGVYAFLNNDTHKAVEQVELRNDATHQHNNQEFTLSDNEPKDNTPKDGAIATTEKQEETPATTKKTKPQTLKETKKATVTTAKKTEQQPTVLPNTTSKKVLSNIETGKKISNNTVEKKAATTTTATPKEEVVLSGTIQASVVLGKAPLDVNFDVDGKHIVSYLWDFGDNSPTASSASPFHTYKEPGTYQVELIILDKNANAKTLIQVIEVEKNITSSLGFIPNAFSPNGDGINDVYKLTTTQNIETFYAKVMNTTGHVVFEWNAVDQGWNGTDATGTKLEAGSYYIAIHAIGHDGTEHTKNLRVNLLKE